MKELLRARRYLEKFKRKCDVANRRLEEAYGEMSARYFREFWGTAAKAVNAAIDDIGEVFLRIRRGDRWTFVQRHCVMLDDCLSRNLVNNKSLVYSIAAKYGWQAPRHLTFGYTNVHKAHEFMNRIGRPVVVKPCSSSRGNGITTQIDNLTDLTRASIWASGYGHSIIVEEFIEGDNYRLLFLDGELIGAVRRDAPGIIGDGIRTISELVDDENRRRLHDLPATSLIPLTVDLECRLTLRRQGLHLNLIPERNARIPLKSVINQNSARENHTVLDGIHPSILDLARRVGSVFNLKLFGIDVITKDIGVPLKDSGGIITEINTQPGLHYHDLVSSNANKVPVGEIVLDAIFTRTDQRWCN